jgi:hypothetical protein
MVRARLLLFLLPLVLGSVGGCWCFDDRPPPRAPEECKVTTDPEACRRHYERR